MDLKIVFTGGGTGGHLYPAISIADALRGRATIDFIGTADRLEATIVPKAGYRLHVVRSRPLVRRISFELLRTLLTNAVGVVQSIAVLMRLRPHIVIATGGYVCFPVVLAARFLRFLRLQRGAIALLEPNASPGLTNRLLAPLVDEIWGAFPMGDARFGKKYVCTGIPVRASLHELPSRDDAIAQLGLSPNRRTLLAMGGSQGARSINDALVALIRSDGLPAGWQLVHVTGEREYDRVRATLDASAHSGAVRPYLDNLSGAYACADLVVARSGASTLAEFATLGLPSILVPYPHAADDHQTRNAQAFASAGAAVLLTDRDVVAGRLGAILAEVTASGRLVDMRRAASALRPEHPVATILARIAALVARKTLG